MEHGALCSLLRAPSKRSVGIEIQTPTGRRPYSSCQVEPHQPIQEARADADPRERSRKGERLARTGAPHIGEHDDARPGPAVRQLEPGAPEGVAIRGVAPLAPPRPRPPTITIAF